MENSSPETHDLDRAEIAIIAQKISFSEFLDSEQQFSSSYVAIRGSISRAERMREHDTALNFPKRAVRIIVEERESSTLLDMTNKFPLGMLKICKDEIYARAFVSPKLFSALIHSPNTSVDGSITLSVSLPYYRSYEEDAFYPILSYGFQLEREIQ